MFRACIFLYMMYIIRTKTATIDRVEREKERNGI